MVYDLNDNHQTKAKLTLEISKSSPLTHITDNPSDGFSNSGDPTKNTPNPTGVNSRPTTSIYKTSKMTRVKFLSKRNQSLYRKTNHNTSTPHRSTVQNPTLPIIQLSIQIQMIILLTTLLSIMTMKALSKFIPKQIYFLSFQTPVILPHSFLTEHLTAT